MAGQIPALLAGLLLAGCGAGVPVAPVAQGDLRGELMRVAPQGPEGACWAHDIIPAVIETVTEQVMVAPAAPGPDGRVRPATFESVTRQQIVQDRAEVWFRSPCPAEMTVALVASLQRALKARGLYALPVTGVLDAATREAIRRFQEPRGLDSDQLSLAAARELGLVATGLDQL